jgi:hypothetical protein
MDEREISVPPLTFWIDACAECGGEDVCTGIETPRLCATCMFKSAWYRAQQPPMQLFLTELYIQAFDLLASKMSERARLRQEHATVDAMLTRSWPESSVFWVEVAGL